MFALLVFIYSFLAALIITLLLRFGFWIVRKVISVAWWIVRNCLVLLWKVLRWGVAFIVARVRAARTVQAL